MEEKGSTNKVIGKTQHRKEFISDIAELIDYPRYQVEDVLRGYEQVLMERLAQMKYVQLWHMGRFETKIHPSTRAFHPIRKEYYYRPEKISIRFLPGKVLSRKVKEAWKEKQNDSASK